MFSARFFASLLFCCFAIQSSVAAEDIRSHPEVQGALKAADAWLEGFYIYERLAGMSAGIVLDQELIWSAGYGYSNVEAQRPADADTIYSVCSISKLFTSIAIMQLRDAGKLRLSDPLDNYLEWISATNTHDDSRPITIESLLTHSSGLLRNTERPIWNGPEFPFPTLDELKQTLDLQETAYQPQTLYHYSNLAFALLGEVVHQRSGQTYQEYLKENILGVLELSDTRAYYPNELRGEQLAIGYAGMGRSGTRLPLEAFDTRAFAPAAGLTSSVTDLGSFASWQFRLLENGGDEVLSVGTLREMHRIHWVNPDLTTTQGIGFYVDQLDDNTVVQHGGDCPGYVTNLSMIPKEKVASIVLTNAGDAPATRLSHSVLKVITAAIKGSETPYERTVPDLSIYEGNYDSLDSGYGGEQAIRQWGDQLVSISIPSNDLGDAMSRLEFDNGHEFLSVRDGEAPQDSYIFEIGSDGKAARIYQDGVYWTRIE
jgi:CubicO group peptidase (beta-lactamase class C family)